MDLIEAEDIKRWQDYIELHKKDLLDATSVLPLDLEVID